MDLLKALRLLIFGLFSMGLDIFKFFGGFFNTSLHILFQALRLLKVLWFIVFSKVSRPYVYSLPYVLSGLY